MREINQTLPHDKKIRVLGGDPPIKWEKIKSREDHESFLGMRDSFPSRLAIEQAFKLNKKVLILFGDGHLSKVPNNLRGQRQYGIENRIEEEHPDSVKVLALLNPHDLNIEDRMHELEKGKLYETNNHWTGEIEAELYFPMVFYRDGSGKATAYAGYSIKNLYDALLYLGPQNE